MRLFSLLGVAGALFAATLTVQAAEPLRALLITGGCCHDYGEQLKILTNGISARANVTWTVLWEGGSSKGDVVRDHKMSIYGRDDWAKGYDIVVHNECFGDVTNADFVNHIAEAHKNGVAGVVIHCSIHSYRKAETDEWRQCLGVSSYNHENARKFEVVNLAPENPIMKSFPAKWNDPEPDELYRIMKIWPNTTPLAYGIGVKGATNCCVWQNTYGKARIFGTTLGHGDITMASDTYLDMLTRGVLWACHKLKDDGTAEEGYGKGALQ